MDPHSISEIIDSVIRLGEILGEKSKAKEISESLEKRIQKIKNKVHANIPKILAIELIEPFFTAGH